MKRFHINQENGNVGECHATVSQCPFGRPEDHFVTVGEAHEAYEASMGGSFNTNPFEEHLPAVKPQDMRAAVKELSAYGKAAFDAAESVATATAWKEFREMVRLADAVYNGSYGEPEFSMDVIALLPLGIMGGAKQGGKWEARFTQAGTDFDKVDEALDELCATRQSNGERLITEYGEAFLRRRYFVWRMMSQQQSLHPMDRLREGMVGEFTRRMDFAVATRDLETAEDLEELVNYTLPWFLPNREERAEARAQAREARRTKQA